MLLFILTGLLASVLLVVLSTTVFVVDVPFLNIPSRAIFAAPFLYLLGCSGNPQPALAEAQAAWSGPIEPGAPPVGLSNYYRGLEFHNPIYAVPTREIVAQVLSRYRPGDVIVTEPDTGFSYYCQRTETTGPLMDQ